MQLRYKKVLVLGATSGIGWALAAKLVETGTSVVAVGRRRENLDDFKSQYGRSSDATVDIAVFDITKLGDIPQFVKEIFGKHADIDCVMLNSGIQRHLDWTEYVQSHIPSHRIPTGQLFRDSCLSNGTDFI
jgi:NADP-dependent 3-hydroxy acid dehydrogenase YdfG